MNPENVKKTYELINEFDLADLKTRALLFRHRKNGARVLCMENEDPNKVFYIGFRTPPKDSTGVAHIIEHSVLCGSKKYPSKDPFVELAKGSLNTFLNAITFPDKTLYPVASENDKDFQNLMDVYMDAALHPNIYERKEIFQQEGWHYELAEEAGEITLNGVVYNEMKGAFSSPEDVLTRKILNTMNPDNCYANESGGDPAVIPELTYEGFLDFHRKYYHPSNSYIYLYGNCDMEEKLRWLDEAYLAEFDAIEPESVIRLQKAFDKPIETETTYNIADSEEEKENTYLALSCAVETLLEKELYVAFDILDYALLSMPGAPVKQALLDAGIGKDVYGGYDAEVFQPIFSIIAKDADKEQKEEFRAVVRKALEEQVENGIDKKALLAGINSSEFRFREADFGSYPKGLIYGFQVLDSWLYDDEKPVLHLDAIPVYELLRKKLEEGGYFEGLVKKYLLENPHTAWIMVAPEKGLVAKQEEALQKKLAEKKAQLSDKEVEDLIAQTKHLKQYQEEPSTEEELLKLPLLEREDIRKTPNPIINEEREIDGIKTHYHDIATNGIAYARILFFAEDLQEEDLPYFALLKSVLGYMDTEHYDYRELSNEINLYTGGIGSSHELIMENDTQENRLCFEFMGKALYSNFEKAADLMKEILFSTKIEDDKRLYEIVAEIKSRLSVQLSSAGHAVSSLRAISYVSEAGCIRENLGGISFYRLISALENDFDGHKEYLKQKLKDLCKKLFIKNRAFISLTCDRTELPAIQKTLGGLAASFPEGTVGEKVHYHPEKKNEGFLDASQVQYVSRAGNFLAAGRFTGILRLLKPVLSYDYLWINVRVKGGAYGVMCQFLRNGDAWFCSYRDPHLRETNEVFEGIPEYLRNYSASEREMTKSIIGTISDLDQPMNPDAKGLRSTIIALSKVTEEDLQRERTEILNATQEDLRAMAPYIEAILGADAICAIGNENVLKKEEELFLKKEALL